MSRLFRCCLLFLGFALLPLPRAQAQPVDLPLHDDWHIQSSADVAAGGSQLSSTDYTATGWFSASVPKTVLSILAANGVYEAPYHGENLKRIGGYRDGRWLVMPEDSPFRSPWWYRKTFTVPEDANASHWTLHLDGVNYQANVWLNGAQVADAGSVRGMFRRFSFPVTELVRRDAPNVLAIEVLPPGLIPDKDYHTKQVQATTGWDDHNPQPPDMNMGLWRDVYLSGTGPVILKHPYVESDLALPSLDEARLTVSVFAENRTRQEQQVWIEGGIGAVEFRQEVTLGPGEEREIFFRPESFSQLVFIMPRVWWPHPMGGQPMYTLELRCTAGGGVSDAVTQDFAIREIETYLNEEDWRQYKVNGRKVLIRGGAWMTSDMLLDLTPERYEALVRYARNAGMNMLRSEGFSIRESNTFYRFCDEYGVMVTQQIFGRSIPDEELAIACVDDMFLRIRNHPSLVHFLGHDETYPTETLDQAYRDLMAKHRLDQSYQPHSGTFFTTTRKKTGGTRTGTRELWTYAGPSHYYLRRHDGAWGFAQSGGIGGILARPDSLYAMLPEDQRWPPLETPAWSFHTVIQGGQYFNAIREVMDAKYGPPSGLPDFCRKLYAMNYNSARGMFEAYGRNKYDATGITTWKYNAAWPAALTWQYVDWYLRPTAAYYGAKKACEPLHIQYAYDDASVYVVNSTLRGFASLNARAALYQADMTLAWQQEAAVRVPPDGVVKAFPVEPPEALTDTHFLRLELSGETGDVLSTNLYWLSNTPDVPGTHGYTEDGVFYVEPKSMADFTALKALPPASLRTRYSIGTEDGQYEVELQVTNNSDVLAFMVHAAIRRGKGGPEAAPVYWSDNYLSLLPGESRELRAVAPIHALEGMVPQIDVSGWNVDFPWTAPVSQAP